ncbi:MAG: hypothetical protein ACP5PP_08905 [Fervidobacterium sp.]
MSEKDILRMVTVENDKLYVSGTAKIGMENFSSVDISIGLTKVLPQDEDYLKVADEVFYQKILPKLEEYAKAMSAKLQPLIDIQKQIKANSQAQVQAQTQTQYRSKYTGYNKGSYGNYKSNYMKKSTGQ